MDLKKLGAAFLAVLALGGLVASSSQAMTLRAGGTKFANGQQETFKITEIGKGELTTKILGSAFRKTNTGLELVEGKLVQNGSTVEGTGKLKLTGVTLDEPAGCKVASTLETVAARGVVAHGNTEATKSALYMKFTPVSGETFMTIKITECSAAGSYQLKGSVYGKMINPTGVEAVNQQIDFSAAINASQGGALTLGKEPAVLVASVEGAMSGVNAGKTWSITE